MQAIILAAGMGKRLGELTRDNTKCMIQVNGISLIDRMLTQLSDFELTRVIIVIGYKGKELRDYIDIEYKGLKIEYIENSIYDKTNNIYSLALAKKELQEDDTLLIESDLIFDNSLFSMIINHPYPNLAMVAKYEPWMDGTMVRIDEDCNIVNFISKKAFKYGDIDTYYKTVNIYKFSKEFAKTHYVPFLEAYTKALGNNEYYEQVLRVITLLDKCELKALVLENQKWYEIDDIQDLNIAETMFANIENKVTLLQKRYGGYWRFPFILDFCYLVNPYFPSLRLKEELKANFDVLLTEYPSGANINSLLIGKYFRLREDYVCVGNGAAELIKSFMTTLKGNIGIIYPTFEEYPNRYNKQQIITYIPPNLDFSYSVNDLKSFFKDKNISALLLVNPDNPSGNFILKKDLKSLAQWTEERDVILLLDESFVDFSDGGIENSLLDNDILEQYKNLVVIKSISKSYGVPGLRLGLLASGNKDLVKYIRRDFSIWNINSFAEFYMQIFGKYEHDYKEACLKFQIERNRFYLELNQICFLRVIRSQANYFLCEVINRFSSKELSEILLYKYNILIKDCSLKYGFNGRNYIRIAIRDSNDNRKLITALKDL